MRIVCTTPATRADCRVPRSDAAGPEGAAQAGGVSQLPLCCRKWGQEHLEHDASCSVMPTRMPPAIMGRGRPGSPSPPWTQLTYGIAPQHDGPALGLQRGEEPHYAPDDVDGAGDDAEVARALGPPVLVDLRRAAERARARGTGQRPSERPGPADCRGCLAKHGASCSGVCPSCNTSSRAWGL